MRPVILGAVAAARRRSGGTPTVLGYNTAGATGVVFTAGFMQVSKFTLASAGILTELHGHFVGGSGQNIRIVVYDDDGASAAPGTRLAYSSSIALPASGAYQANETGLSVALAAGDYYVGAIGQIAAGTLAYETTGSTSYRVSGAAFTPPPTPFPGGATVQTRKTSCWAIVLV